MSEEALQDKVVEPIDVAQEQINKIKSDVDYIIKSKEEIDVALKSIKTAESTIQEAKGSIKSELSTISQSKSKFEKLEKDAQAKTEELNNEIGSLQLEINALTQKKEALKNIVSELEKIKEESNKIKSSTEENVKKINESKTHYEVLKVDSDQKAKELVDSHAALQATINNFHTKYSELEACHKKYLIDEKDETGNITTKSVQTQINELNSKMEQQYKLAEDNKIQAANELKTFKTSTEKEVKELKVALEKEIRDLLPDAGAAGLASAYCEAKGYYGPIKDSEDVLGKIAYTLDLIKRYIKPTFNYILFICPLIIGFVILFSGTEVEGIKTNIFDGMNESSITFDERLFYRVILSIPLITISIFGLMSIRMNRRLYEEYNHKQRVMQLYHSFKEEVGENGENKAELIKIMLGVVKDKPSLAMKRYENNMDNFFIRLFGRQKKD